MLPQRAMEFDEAKGAQSELKMVSVGTSLDVKEQQRWTPS